MKRHFFFCKEFVLPKYVHLKSGPVQSSQHSSNVLRGHATILLDQFFRLFVIFLLIGKFLLPREHQADLRNLFRPSAIVADHKTSPFFAGIVSYCQHQHSASAIRILQKLKLTATDSGPVQSSQHISKVFRGHATILLDQFFRLFVIFSSDRKISSPERASGRSSKPISTQCYRSRS
jgi:hypothetical protein